MNEYEKVIDYFENQIQTLEWHSYQCENDYKAGYLEGYTDALDLAIETATDVLQRLKAIARDEAITDTANRVIVPAKNQMLLWSQSNREQASQEG